MAVAAAAAAPVASAAARGRRVGGRLRSGVRGRGRHRLPSRLPPLPRGEDPGRSRLLLGGLPALFLPFFLLP